MVWLKQKHPWAKFSQCGPQFAKHDLESSVTRLLLVYWFAKVISFIASMILNTPHLSPHGSSFKQGQRGGLHTPFMCSHFAKWLLPALGCRAPRPVPGMVWSFLGLEIVLSLLFQLIALMHPECIRAAAPNHWVIIYSQASSPLSSLLLGLTLQGVNVVWLVSQKER